MHDSIDFTKRFAKAQTGAFRILEAMEFGPDLTDWITNLSLHKESGNICIIRCTFWIGNDPNDTLYIDVQLSSEELKPALLWHAFVTHDCMEQQWQRWDFDPKGNPVRV